MADVRLHRNHTAFDGVIFSLAEFPSTIAVANGDALFAKYTLSVS